MHLWTFQHPIAYDMLAQGITYYCDSALSNGVKYMDFGKAYAWMAEQMIKRIGDPPPSVDLPVWAWHTWNWKHVKPDLRYASFHYDSDHYLMELEIPDNKVLLSDEENWHYVLSDMYLAQTSCEQEWDVLMEAYDALSPTQQKSVRLSSWPKIFDVSPIDNSPWTWSGKYVQATLWEIKPEYVVNSRFVKGRFTKHAVGEK